MLYSRDGTAPRVLFVLQNFRQGSGGAPESVRLMASQLLRLGLASDVYDRGRIARDVGNLSLLPESSAAVELFDLSTTCSYMAVLQTSPWQSPRWIRRLLNARRDVPWIYLPRGGLGRIEFSRLRDLKKYPYLALVERGFVAASDLVVFSSETERRHTLPWSFDPSRAVVIPDFVAPTPYGEVEEADEAVEAATTFSFLAEISPRKGLHLLVDAFVEWVLRNRLGGRVRLVVGGAPRAGSEAYLDAIRARQTAVARDVEITFVGAVAHGDRAAFYAATDVLVVASSFESFGLTIFEAMNQGCLVVSTPDVGALEQIRSVAGVIVLPAPTIECMIQGLEASFKALDRGKRVDRVTDAKQAIQTLNDTATTRWSDILSPAQSPLP